MLPTNGNILDQLLGGFDTAQLTTVGSTPQVGVATDSAVFDNLLSMLVNGQGVITEPVTEETETAQPTQPNRTIVPFEQFMSKVVVDGPEIVQETGKVIADGDLAALVADESAGWLEEKPMLERELPQISLPNRPDTIIPTSFIANQNIRDMVNSQPVDLESAIYKVMDAKISGDNLELTVVADGNSTEPVKLTVPAELLTSKDAGNALTALRGDKTKSTAVTGVERVALADTGTPATENLDELLAKMNLKAVEVKLAPVTNATHTEKQQVTLQMFGVVDGNQIVIKSKLDKQQIDTRTDDNTARLATPRVSSTPLDTNDKMFTEDTIKTETRPTERPVAIPIEDERRRMPFNLIEKLAANENGTRFETTGFQTDNLSAKADMMPRLDSAATEMPTAKMSLPPTFEKVLRPGGQSVMIKIDPEQLGPARLNLTIHNNVLTARVTVDSAIAKMAVEHSLEQLTDQLSKAGIDVDRIEVELSDKESREQFFHRRPNWAQPGKLGSGRTDESFELEQVTPSPTLYTPPNEFLRADGVNLLA